MTYFRPKRDPRLVNDQYRRLRAAFDRGHDSFVRRAEHNLLFYSGRQWDDAVIAKLNESKRPYLTINLTKAVLSTLFGFMLDMKTEATFLPKEDGDARVAEILGKLYKHIAQVNDLRHVDMDVAMEGFITSRGFFDVRLGAKHGDPLSGQVTIRKLDCRDVLLDPDARTYDPSGWRFVMLSRWLSLDEIESLYGHEVRELLEGRPVTDFDYASEASEVRNRPATFGQEDAGATLVYAADDKYPFRYRLLELQERRLRTRKVFADLRLGATKPVPEDWDDDRVFEFLEQLGPDSGIVVIRHTEDAIWTRVTCGDVVLYDGWSSYPDLTVVPFFPWFVSGKTISVVDDLEGLQDMYNKVMSQILHVVNTTSNSGWKVKTGSLVNMTVEELEERGAETGLVLELTDLNGAEKITANQPPTGLTDIVRSLADMLKFVSGVSDSARGFDNPDVAAKALSEKRLASQLSMMVPFANLDRSRKILARLVLRFVQKFYTRPMVLRVLPEADSSEDLASASPEELRINHPDALGRILNDVTVGNYDVTIITVPDKRTYRERQFEQAVALRELGVPIPDEYLVRHSLLLDKNKVVAEMQAQRQAQLQMLQQQQQIEAKATLAKTAADVEKRKAEADLLRTRQAQVEKDIMLGLPNEGLRTATVKANAELMAKLVDSETADRRLLAQLQGETNARERTQRAHNPGNFTGTGTAPGATPGAGPVPGAAAPAEPGPGPGPGPGPEPGPRPAGG